MQVYYAAYILKKKSQLNIYIARIFYIKFTILLLDQLITIANYFKKQKSGVIAEKVFSNPLLAEKIIRNLDMQQLFRLREVNKSLNNACQGVFRKDHRSMKIEFMQFPLQFRTTETILVHINLVPVRLTDFAHYIRFLNKVAGLQVERIEVIDFWKLSSNPANAPSAWKFHEDIHSELIGNNNVKAFIGLPGEFRYCLECNKISKTCLEYGPINQFWMQTNKKGRHFQRILVTDVFLDKLANSLVSDTQSKKECHKLLEDRFARPNISCTTLTLCIHERRDTNNTAMPQDHTPIPWEVLEMALKKWKVQNIEIKFILNFKHMPYIETWSARGDFTAIRFNDPVTTLENLQFPQKCSDVHVDLSRSVYCGTALKIHNQNFRGYKNLIANIRRIFHPEQISINFSHWLFLKPLNLQDLLENFLRISRLGFHQNLTISFKVYIEIEEYTKISGKFESNGPLRLSYRNVMKRDQLNYFRSEKWVGERYKFVDFEKNFTLNADVFVEEESYKKVMLEEHQATDFMGMFQLDVFE